MSNQPSRAHPRALHNIMICKIGDTLSVIVCLVSMIFSSLTTRLLMQCNAIAFMMRCIAQRQSLRQVSVVIVDWFGWPLMRSPHSLGSSLEDTLSHIYVIIIIHIFRCLSDITVTLTTHLEDNNFSATINISWKWTDILYSQSSSLVIFRRKLTSLIDSD